MASAFATLHAFVMLILYTFLSMLFFGGPSSNALWSNRHGYMFFSKILLAMERSGAQSSVMNPPPPDG
jgi:hypothetical protein